ncbi:MAG: DEAD/DEAH box helicase, partial [Thermoplasmata archaeon]
SAVLAVKEANAEYQVTQIPDLLGYLQRETELTRSTLAEILIQSGRLGEVPTNPQQFLDQAVQAIKKALNQLIIDGVKYEKIAGEEYEMLLFEEKEIEGYLSRLLQVHKSIYDAIEFESETEKRFAEVLDQREDIKLFIKLPRWFTVDTPIGPYNPDWAIVKQEDDGEEKLYLVTETKATKEELQLRAGEWKKIQCGKAHFDALDVKFKHAVSPEEI